MLSEKGYNSLMEGLVIVSAILLSFSISLGVGSSTLAILEFFKAIADGQIDETERGMLGIVYVVLRVAMAAILLTYLLQLFIGYSGQASFLYDTPHAYAIAVLLAVLYVNAILMTAKIMPSTFGPALQASTWYTMGVVSALLPLQISEFTMWQFLFGYGSMFLIMAAIVNSVMAYLKYRKVTDGD